MHLLELLLAIAHLSLNRLSHELPFLVASTALVEVSRYFHRATETTRERSLTNSLAISEISSLWEPQHQQ